jgi:hypothetical protein
MAPDEYNKALDKALNELEQRVQQRDVLNAEIAGLKETVRVLSSRTEMSPEKQQQIVKLLAMVDSATPKLTDAVRALLTRKHPQAMTAIEIRNELEESSNFDDFSNSLSACHAALKRMLNDREVEPGPPKEGKSTYRRVLEPSDFGLALTKITMPENSSFYVTLAKMATSQAAPEEGHLSAFGRPSKRSKQKSD